MDNLGDGKNKKTEEISPELRKRKRKSRNEMTPDEVQKIRDKDRESKRKRRENNKENLHPGIADEGNQRHIQEIDSNLQDGTCSQQTILKIRNTATVELEGLEEGQRQRANMDNIEKPPAVPKQKRKRRSDMTPEKLLKARENDRKSRQKRKQNNSSGPANDTVQHEADIAHNGTSDGTVIPFGCVQVNTTPGQTQTEIYEEREGIDCEGTHSHIQPSQKEAVSGRVRRCRMGQKKRTTTSFHNVARDYNEMPEQFSVGEMNISCNSCGALHFQNEMNCKKQFNACCSSGAFKLEGRHMYPIVLQNLLQEDGEESNNFRKNIRKYNSAFAFVSFGYKPANLRSTGPPVFVIHGQVYHKTSESVTPEKIQPTYSQLYFLDPEFATENRLNNTHNKTCKKEIFIKIESMLRDINPYAKAFRMMKDVMSTSSQDIRMWIVRERGNSSGTYSLPTANEVAAVFVTEDGEPPITRDICMHPQKSDQLQHVSILSPNCDPMTYPLLFPFGDEGWNVELRKPNGRRISQLEFYSFLLQERCGEFNALLHSFKLSQQFIVDAFLKVEANRIHWHRENQKQLRVEQYLGLMDYVSNEADKQNVKAGKVCILPSSFTGSKRAMTQNYQDAMAVVGKFGKPDLFITFTCNPTWPEITQQLREHEHAIDRPDIVATVFYLKLKELMKDLTERNILGTTISYLSVIEFQKRGLPHCHMLFMLSPEDKFTEPDEVDKAVSAEIPDPIEDPVLYEIVSNMMIHGPCGEFNENASCMEEIGGVKQCLKKFPKEFCNSTLINTDGYPQYRRRNDGRVCKKGDFEFDNRYVVPFNRYLSKKYNAHINVEICSSVKSVKYIFKYIYKGHDAAIVKVSNGESTLEWNEIADYLNTRYLAAPEAMWRLREYPMHGRSHAVIRLAVHLPQQQPVIFREGDEENAILEAQRKGTTLTAWFNLNSDATKNSKHLLYPEIPYHFVLSRHKEWEPRKQSRHNIISRMYAVSPKDFERYCLRLMLLHIRGATCFKDLRTVKGVVYDTFKEAATAMGLLENDDEWDSAMSEAVSFHMPSQLRILLCTIFVVCEPKEPKLLYEKFKDDLIEDFMLHHTEKEAENLALNEIQSYLTQFGKSCSYYGLPKPTPIQVEEQDCTEEIARATEMESLLNEEQKLAFQTVINSVLGNGTEKCFYLSGAGGCGKTFLYNTLISKVLSMRKKVKVVAPTGLAATLMKNGQTVHTGFGIPIKLDKNTVSRIAPNSLDGKALRDTSLIIWDEISMCHVNLLRAVDASLRDLKNKDIPFGGITIVVGGDFRQQAPVVRRGTRVKIVESCVKSNATLWNQFKELRLTINMRVAKEEVAFKNWLLQVGAGERDGHKTDFVTLPEQLVSTDIVTSVFGPNINEMTASELAARTILCPRNEDTLKLNDKILEQLNGESKIYYSVDEIECDTEEEKHQFPPEFINSQTPMGMPPHALKVKKGCCVMLLRNLNYKRGLCNGTRLIVENPGANIIECTIFSGERKGQRVFIPRIRMDVNDEDFPFILRRKQFPMRLAYLMTITKSQGQTFEKIGIYLPQPVFTHGQLYTALSRVKSMSGLFVEFTRSKYKESKTADVFNCVYREIL